MALVGLGVSAVQTSDAAFSLIDNFEGYAANTPIHQQGQWRAEAETDSVAAGVATDPLSPGNQVMNIGDGGFESGRLGHRETINIDPRLRLDQGTMGTYFFRMAWDVDQVNLSVGMSDVANPISDTLFNPFSQFESQLRIAFTPGADELSVLDGGSFRDLTAVVNPLVWYSFWLVVDNADDLTEMYVLGGDFTTQTQLDSQGITEFGFRNGTASNDLTTFFIATGRNTDSQPPDPTENIGPVYIDDLYVDLNGANLTNPIPESGPAGFLLLSLAGALAISRTRPGLKG